MKTKRDVELKIHEFQDQIPRILTRKFVKSTDEIYRISKDVLKMKNNFFTEEIILFL